MAESIVYNEDCMMGMARYPDKYFDLAGLLKKTGHRDEADIGLAAPRQVWGP